LTTVIGFIVNFTPDGQTASKNDSQEYHSASKAMGKIESMMLFVTLIIEKFKKKQEERIKQYNTTLRSRKEQTKDIYNRMNKYCIAMDNYFILPKVIEVDAKFNDLYYCVDKYETLVTRWMDNGLVYCVTTLHRIHETVIDRRLQPLDGRRRSRGSADYVLSSKLTMHERLDTHIHSDY